jgi:hypothetical protein
MSATTELLDAWKATRGVISDNAAAGLLGVGRAAISRWRNTPGQAEAHLIARMARECGQEPGGWLARVEAERAKSDPDRKAWTSVARKFGAAAAFALCAVAVPLSAGISSASAVAHYAALHLTA